MSNILVNKNQLNDYLSDFHPNKIDELMNMFDESDFDCGKSSFIKKMKRKISMPKFGKATLNYWIGRGWSKEEALSKRTVVTKDPASSPMNIDFWIKRGYSQKDATFKIKSQRKINKEYWIEKGYSEEESIKRVSDFQQENVKKFIAKKKTDKPFNDSIILKMPNNIKYWLNKGYSEDESKKLLSNRQNTFSLKKCIDRHGGEIGLKIWENRQLRWQESLSKSEYNGRDNKDSKSISFYKKKYKENWIEKFILQFKNINDIRYLTSFADYKELIIKLIEDKNKLADIKRKIMNPLFYEIYLTNKEDIGIFLSKKYTKGYGSVEYYKHIYGNEYINKFIEKNSYADKDEVSKLISYDSYQSMLISLVSEYKITDIILKIQNKIISFYYETTYEDMFKYLTSLNPYIDSKFGRMRYFNNHICRSDGEFIIAKFLSENKIKYEYEKRYGDAKMRCDFYLIDYDLYIEYTGMNTTDGIDRYKNKKELLSEKYNIIFSNDISYIKNEIQKICI